MHLIKKTRWFRGDQQHQSHAGSTVLSAITAPHSSHTCTPKHTHHSVQNRPTLYQRAGLCHVAHFNTFNHKTNIAQWWSSHHLDPHVIVFSRVLPSSGRFRSPRKDRRGSWLDLLWSCLNLNDNGAYGGMRSTCARSHGADLCWRSDFLYSNDKALCLLFKHIKGIRARAQAGPTPLMPRWER